LNKTETRYILLDTAEPAIDHGVGTPSGNFSQDWILGNVTAIDSHGLSNLTISLYNISGLVDSNATEVSNSLTYNFTGLADGTYYLNSTVKDLAGNINTTSTLNITLDTTMPVIDFNDGATDAGNFSQNWILGNLSFSDAWINSSAIYLYNESGLVDSSISGVSPHSYNFTSLADGSYQMNASVWDLAGNVNYTETRAILLDTSEPSIGHGTGTPSGNFSQDWIFGNVTAIDSHGLSNLTISLYNISGLVDSNATEVSDSLTYNFTGLADGTYYLNSTVEDLSGNVNATSTLTIILDTTMPVIDFNDGATDAGNFSQNWIFSNLSFSDAWINSSVIDLYNSSGLVDSSISGVSPHSHNFTSLADGYYQMNASVWDFAGNINYTETRAILLDTTDPEITFDASTLEEGNHSQDWIFGNVSASDNLGIANITFYLYNSTGLFNSTSYSGNDLSVNFTPLPSGMYYLNASVEDLAGNIVMTDTKIYGIDAIDMEISNVDVGSLSDDSATITWETNENANSTVYYGLDANLTLNASKATFTVDHSITLDNLAQNTLYYYKVESYDIFGFNNSSVIGTFTTDIKKSTSGGSGGGGGGFNYYPEELQESPEGDNEPCGSISEGTKAVNVGRVQAGDTIKVSTTEYIGGGDCMVTGLDIDMKNNVDDMGVIITQSSSSS